MRRWSRPSWFAWSLLVIGLALFVRLAVWQLHRAEEKQELLDAHAAAATAPPRSLADVARDEGSTGFPRVVVRGRYLPRPTWLIDEQVRDGRVGMLAIALFAPVDGGPRLLVNRGWIATAPGAARVPTLPSLPDGDVELHGIYAPASAGGLRLGADAAPTADDVRVVLRIDPHEVAQELGVAVHPRLLLLDPDDGSGFVRRWTPAILPPSRHLGYAVQWFSFALAALVIFVVLHWRPDRGEKQP